MDIYFCDECAARVTDADLHRGYGIKKADVVICGQCIDKGLGKQRLAQAGVNAPLADDFLDEVDDHPSAQEHDSQDYIEHESSEPSVNPPLVPSDDHQNPAGMGEDDLSDVEVNRLEETDVVRRQCSGSDDLVSAAGGFAALSGDDPKERLFDKSDLEELHGLAGVEAKREITDSFSRSPREATDWDSEHEDRTPSDDEIIADVAENAEDSPIDHHLDDDDAVPADLDGDDNEYVSNEAGFADQDEDEDSEEDDEDEDEDEDEDTEEDDDEFGGYDDEDEEVAQGNIETLAMGRADHLLDDGSSAADEEASGHGSGGRKRRRRKGKRRNNKGSAASVAKVPRAGQIKPPTGNSARSSSRMAASSSSSRIASKSSKTTKAGKSSRRAAPTSRNKNLPVILGSIISILVVLILFAALAPGILKSGRGDGGGPSDPVSQMRVQVERAHQMSISSQRSDSLSELEAANRAIQEAQQMVYRLTENLPAGWTENDLQNELRRLKFHDLQGQARNVRDRISVLRARGQ